MLQKLETLFREMTQSRDLRTIVETALQGLQDLLPTCRARLVSQSLELSQRLRGCRLPHSFILAQQESADIKALQEALKTGLTVLGSEGSLHCCVVPFEGGALYVDSPRSFPENAETIVSMVAQQLLANIHTSNFGLRPYSRDPLRELDDETSFSNQLNRFDEFTIVNLEIVGFQEHRDRNGWRVRDQILRELVALLAQELDSSSLLARSNNDGILVMTPRDDKKIVAERWRHFLEHFESQGIGKTHQLTMAAGLALYPDDGERYFLKSMVQRACTEARFCGVRVLAVAEPPQKLLADTGSPHKKFSAGCTNHLDIAIRECQSRRRPVDTAAVLWALADSEAKLTGILQESGLRISELSKKLESSDEETVSFTEALKNVFATSLEFAHRCGRPTIESCDLLLACLCDADIELLLRQLGLNYPRLLAGLHRSGQFTTPDTFLIGHIQMEAPVPIRRTYDTLRTSRAVKALPNGFGSNFSSHVWALLGLAQTEAKRARHNLDFEHLYLALLLMQERPTQKAQRVLESFGFEEIEPESSTTTQELVYFLETLSQALEEVSLQALEPKLLKHTRIRFFISCIENLPDKEL